ncbi:MAG: sugar phosphate isomerase/epimerase [Phycisphaerae bacterium]|nr:sugar phosphate isomerase/epimerase [Phycisphaerae bacterium]
MSDNRITVFSKPWNLPLAEMAAAVKKLGFDGVELPVRPGFAVTPENVERDLPQAVRILGEHGLVIGSVAGPTDEPTIAACAAAGVPIIRVLVKVPEGGRYMATMHDAIREYETLLPVLEGSGVTIGIQNHCYREVSSVMGIRYLVEKFPASAVGAVLDVGHCGLAGEFADLAVDILWDHLCLVNLKNAVWRRTNDETEPTPEFGCFWTLGKDGMASWEKFISELKKRNYTGDYCLTAEYSAKVGEDLTGESETLIQMITEDLSHARSLTAGEAWRFLGNPSPSAGNPTVGSSCDC